MEQGLGVRDLTISFKTAETCSFLLLKERNVNYGYIINLEISNLGI
jgi:hypothetical protein